MRLYKMIKPTDRYQTREQRKFKLPYFLLFGKGLNGDRSNTASGGKKSRD